MPRCNIIMFIVTHTTNFGLALFGLHKRGRKGQANDMFWRTVHDFSKWTPVALAAVFTAFVTATLGAAAIWDGAKVWAQNAFEGALDMAALPWIWLLAAAIVLLWLFVVIWSGRKVASQDRENLLDQDRAQALREVADLRNMTDSITARAPMVDYDDPYREVDRTSHVDEHAGYGSKGENLLWWSLLSLQKPSGSSLP